MVRESDPTNNVPDNIFSKIGLQLHQRDNHPIAILKNAIYDYFDTSYSSKFVKFDDLCPIVSVQQVILRHIISFLFLFGNFSVVASANVKLNAVFKYMVMKSSCFVPYIGFWF